MRRSSPTGSSKPTRRHTTSPLVGSSTVGTQEPKWWEATSAVTSPMRSGTTGPTTGSRLLLAHQRAGSSLLEAPALFYSRIGSCNLLCLHIWYMEGIIEGLAFYLYLSAPAFSE